jgi:hypothetical protein
VWLALGFAALLVIGAAGVTGKAESAGRSLSTPAVIALGALWAGWIALVIRRMARQLLGETSHQTSQPPDR